MPFGLLRWVSELRALCVFCPSEPGSWVQRFHNNLWFQEVRGRVVDWMLLVVCLLKVRHRRQIGCRVRKQRAPGWVVIQPSVCASNLMVPAFKDPRKRRRVFVCPAFVQHSSAVCGIERRDLARRQKCCRPVGRTILTNCSPALCAHTQWLYGSWNLAGTASQVGIFALDRDMGKAHLTPAPALQGGGPCWFPNLQQS